MIDCDRPAHFCTFGPVGALSRAFEERAPLLRTSKNAPCRTEPVFDILDFGLKSDASAAVGQLKAQFCGEKEAPKASHCTNRVLWADEGHLARVPETFVPVQPVPGLVMVTWWYCTGSS